MILRRPAASWRVLAVGLMGYDLNIIDESAKLLEFAKERPTRAVSNLAPAELLAPPDAAEFGRQPLVIKWTLPEVGPGAPQYWFVETIDKQGWPNLVLNQLSATVPHGERQDTAQASINSEIWTIPADGKIVFSARRHWIYRP